MGTKIETITYAKKLAKLLLLDIYAELKIHQHTFNRKEPIDPFYLKIKSKIDLFYLQYGLFYEEFVSRILLTEINIGRQYQNGANAILRVYNYEITPTASLALLTFYTLMIKSCIRRGLIDFTDSIVEWNCRVFEEHIVNFEKNGGWELVSKSLETDSSSRAQGNISYRTFIKCLIVFNLGCLLINKIVQ